MQQDNIMNHLIFPLYFFSTITYSLLPDKTTKYAKTIMVNLENMKAIMLKQRIDT